MDCDVTLPEKGRIDYFCASARHCSAALSGYRERQRNPSPSRASPASRDRHGKVLAGQVSGSWQIVAAQRKDHLMKEGVNARMRRPAAARRLGEDISRPPGSHRLPKLTDRRHQDHCPENGLLSCDGPVDSAYGASCFGVPLHRILHLCQATLLSWRIGITITHSPTLRSKGFHFYFAKGTFLVCFDMTGCFGCFT